MLQRPSDAAAVRGSLLATFCGQHSLQAFYASQQPITGEVKEVEPEFGVK
jgi:hypothetical protein